MKIKFSYQASPGLRIIEEIGEGKIVWIRGYNGVGKSLAAKLLEMVSGSHVFDSRSEFASLMNSLDKAEIIITRDNGKKLRIVLKPKDWIFDETTRMIKHESVGTFFEENDIITAQQFGSKFNARIIRGNESLPTQITALITQSLDQFRSYGASSENLLNLSKNFMDMIEEELALRDIRDFDNVEKRLAENAINLEKCGEEIQTIKSNIALVSELLQLQKGIHLHNEYTAANLIEKIEATESNLNNLEVEQKKLQEERYEHSYRSRELVETESVRYNSVINRMRSVKTERDNITRALYDKLNELDIQLLPEKGLANRIRNRYQGLIEKEKGIDKEKKQERIVDEVLTKQSHISSTLTEIEPDLDVSNEVIAHGKIPTLETELDITVSELQEMIEVQQSILLEKKKEASFKDYDEELRHIVDQQKKLNEIERLLKQITRIEKKIRGFEAVLRSLVIDRTKYDKHLRRIAEIDKRIRLTQMEIAKTNDALDFLRTTHEKIQTIPSPDELISQRDDLLSELKFDLEEPSSDYLNERLDEFKGLSTLKFKMLNDLKSEAIFLLHKKLELENSFRKNVNKLEKDRKFAFLSQWLKENVGDKPVNIIRKLSEHLVSFVNTIGEFNIRMSDIQRYHEELINFLAQRSTKLLEGKDVEKLEAIFNNRLKDFYKRSIFMKYVFEGFEKIRSFDLTQNQISLVDTKGSIQYRPISSFSSGQKAFAFSISMISLVFSRSSEEKVLFLDEFGALLDYLREDILLEQVQTKVLDENIVQKIVILLPIRERLEEILENLQIQKQSAADSREHERLKKEVDKYKEKLGQLKERGYYQEIQYGS